jgi:hypothetical protein
MKSSWMIIWIWWYLVCERLPSSPSGVDVMSVMAAHYIYAHRVYSLMSHHGPLREVSGVVSQHVSLRGQRAEAGSHHNLYCLSLVLYSTILSPVHTARVKSILCGCEYSMRLDTLHISPWWWRWRQSLKLQILAPYSHGWSPKKTSLHTVIVKASNHT